MFITPDSMVPDMFDPQSLNRYAYCRNNPLIYVDPSGHYREGAQDPWHYTSENGNLAHGVIMDWVDTNYSFKMNEILTNRNEFDFIFDKGLNNLFSFNCNKYGLLRPDILEKNSEEIFEIKPITHINEKFYAKDDNQVNKYLKGLNLNIPMSHYTLGDATKFIPKRKGGENAGSFENLKGDRYTVNMYTNPGRVGFIYYSLRLDSTQKERVQDTLKEFGKALEKAPKNMIYPLPGPGGIPVW